MVLYEALILKEIYPLSRLLYKGQGSCSLPSLGKGAVAVSFTGVYFIQTKSLRLLCRDLPLSFPAWYDCWLRIAEGHSKFYFHFLSIIWFVIMFSSCMYVCHICAWCLCRSKEGAMSSRTEIKIG